MRRHLLGALALSLLTVAAVRQNHHSTRAASSLGSAQPRPSAIRVAAAAPSRPHIAIQPFVAKPQDLTEGELADHLVATASDRMSDATLDLLGHDLPEQILPRGESHMAGHIADDHHQPLAGVRVQAVPLADGEWAGIAIAVTDASGDFVLPHLPPGPLQVTIIPPSRELAARVVLLRDRDADTPVRLDSVELSAVAQ